MEFGLGASKEKTDGNLIKKARQYAIDRHGDQLYGDQPYYVHLDEVAKIASNYGDDATVIAYLHDVIEDTDTTVVEIDKKFGYFISQCVQIVTDEIGVNRKERKRKTYNKMALVSGDLELALIVKAADRLANLRACVMQNNMGLLKMYRSEHLIFKKSVYRPYLCEALWQEIDNIMEGAAD
jgi:(p)ppGpp synthase/HD superfamily hydrolase